ncbi:MAG: imidazole glycerol phosphate synthase subunit HisH, partial [Parvularculaceae bacterium]
TASVKFALERLGAAVRLTDDPLEISEAERLILPGVGAAAFAMHRMDAIGVRDAIVNFKRPLLGICLGQQLLFEESEEGAVETLGLIGGMVRRLPASIAAPAPHMGWSRLSAVKPDPLLEGVREGDYCYFVHSFACPVNEATLAVSSYSGAFAAAIGMRNIYGCQFHPERSGEPGRRILSNFLALPC